MSNGWIVAQLKPSGELVYGYPMLSIVALFLKTGGCDGANWIFRMPEVPDEAMRLGLRPEGGCQSPSGTSAKKTK
jgi:hypothetical protein